jgi:putative peptidoglycan lipid II flippase
MAQATQIIRITAPIIFVIYAASFLASIEFIEGRSALPSLAMIVSGVGGPLGLIWFADRLGVAALAWGALASAVARLLLLMRPRHLRHLLGPGVSVRDPIMRRMAGMMLSRLTTSLFLEMNLLVDRIFASFLGPGYISALTYASRGVVVIVRIFMMPMGRMLLPWMSRLAARQQYERMRALVEKLVIATTSLLVPLVAFIVAFRTELLGIVFGRGAFDRGSVEATSVALLYFALGIIPFLVAPMLSAVFFSLQDSATPLRTGLVCVAANAALDGILVVWMGHGGIALSTSLTGLLRAYLLWVYLRRRLGSLQSRAVLGSLVVSGATAVVAFWSARLLMFLAGPGWVKPVWQLAAYALIGGAGYLVLQNIFNRPVARLIPAVLGRLAAERS